MEFESLLRAHERARMAYRESVFPFAIDRGDAEACAAYKKANGSEFESWRALFNYVKARASRKELARFANYASNARLSDGVWAAEHRPDSLSPLAVHDLMIKRDYFALKAIRHRLAA